MPTSHVRSLGSNGYIAVSIGSTHRDKPSKVDAEFVKVIGAIES
jgi:hypothetical protein